MPGATKAGDVLDRVGVDRRELVGMLELVVVVM